MLCNTTILFDNMYIHDKCEPRIVESILYLNLQPVTLRSCARKLMFRGAHHGFCIDGDTVAWLIEMEGNDDDLRH